MTKQQEAWTAADIARLKKLWLANTTGEIGKMMGRSKNSIIAKAKRLNLPKKRKQQATPKQRPKVKPDKKPQQYFGKAHPPSPCGKPLTQLRQNECRFPIGHPDAQGFHFCAAYTVSTYCDTHHVICHARKR